MSARCGLKLVAVADAAPDNRTFLEKLRPDERAVDFFHAHLSEVSDRREQLEVPRRATTAAARSRYLRDKATTEPEFRVLRGAAYASLKANGCGSGVVRQQGPSASS